VEIRDRLSRLLTEAPADARVLCFGDAWWTWGDVAAHADSLDAALTDLGVHRGGRVGVVLLNRPEHLATVITVLATGRTLVTLSALQPPERLAAYIERADVPVVWCDGDLTPRPSEHPVADAVAIEMQTSGTSGPPKRVVLTDAQLNSSLRAAGMKAGAALVATGLNLCSTPLVHIGGLWNSLATIFSGRKVVLLDRFDQATWVEAVRTHRPRTSGIVPAAMRSLLDAEVDPADLSSLQVVTSGSMSCPPELAEAFTQRFGAKVLMTYGATEFAGAVAGWTLPLYDEWWSRKRGSAGRAFPGIEVRAVDGVLEVKAPQVAGDGWVRTSDLAEIDDAGFLWIKGRADDVIVRGGFKVHPDTVRIALESHPSVLEASVAGVADERLGAVPVAAVELRPGADRPTESELHDLCRQRLLPYEVPTRVLVLDALPRTPALKVSRQDLLALIAERTNP
jgi:acyl-CoA synthetase (AMP-forming)/AMP-acid ligase II